MFTKNAKEPSQTKCFVTNMPFCCPNYKIRIFQKLNWSELSFNQVLPSFQKHFKTIKSNIFKAGNNKLPTSLTVLRENILLQDLNISLKSFKIKYKKTLLKIESCAFFVKTNWSCACNCHLSNI